MNTSMKTRHYFLILSDTEKNEPVEMKRLPVSHRLLSNMLPHKKGPGLSMNN
ncbi:Uncharacterised protein [Klebsiella pneumoniae subsp. ozaenae]|uniref:Uncharacterized protein n=1 Tax=Klebsiella pneumoniae subsp. ozaenae TaxID=574 RepID=A0A377YVJ5_KLEPO|nr:Uncharacterised protein [Klebsiella pneumoniae subsp. ozaenae]